MFVSTFAYALNSFCIQSDNNFKDALVNPVSSNHSCGKKKWVLYCSGGRFKTDVVTGLITEGSLVGMYAYRVGIVDESNFDSGIMDKMKLSVQGAAPAVGLQLWTGLDFSKIILD